MIDYGDPRLPDRFWGKVHPCPITGCWLWGAAVLLGRCAPYPSYQHDGRTQGGHRVVVTVLVDTIPPKWDVDHLCRQTLCVNPAHLEAVPHATNALRGVSPWAENARRTHCGPRGHSLTGDNVYVDARGSRICRACKREWWREASGFYNVA